MPILDPVDELLEPADLADLPGAPFPDSVVAMVCDAVRAECGWHIAPSREETVVLDGSGADVLALPTLYLTAVSAVTELGATVDASTYDWSDAGYLQRRSGCWTRRLRGVEVTMTHGYSGCPAALAALVGALCAIVATNPAIASEAAGSVSVSYRDLAAALDPASQLVAAATLAKYRDPKAA